MYFKEHAAPEIGLRFLLNNSNEKNLNLEWTENTRTKQNYTYLAIYTAKVHNESYYPHMWLHPCHSGNFNEKL